MSHNQFPNFCGRLDAGFRVYGCEEWHKTQRFHGDFCYNNLHGDGVYLIEAPNDSTYFNGKFYANNLEGYGTVIYGNGAKFQGLFKNHRRFGPGILTYPDRTEDIGVWNEFHLIRVSSLIGRKTVPKLADSEVGKVRLLKFRTLVPVRCHPDNAAEEILRNLGREDLLPKSESLYNLNVRNPNSVFFNTTTYDHNYFSVEDCTIDVILSEQEQYFEPGFEDDNAQKDEPECVCFEDDMSKFTKLCLQLHEFEVKAEKLQMQISKYEKQMELCKACCKDPVQSVLTARTASRFIKSFQKASFIGSTHVASSCSLPQFLEQSKSEIEIKNTIYTGSSYGEDGFIDVASEDSCEDLLLRRNCVRIDDVCYDCGEDYVKDTGTQTCYCADLHVENIDSIQRNLNTLRAQNSFYNTIRLFLKDKLDKNFWKLSDFRTQPKIKKIQVTDLLAWNNEDVWIDVLKHCFRHRRFQDNVEFEVNEVLNGCKRGQGPGAQESVSFMFLENCSKGTTDAALECLRKGAYPDVCDSDGNSGIMLAAAGNHLEVVQLLVINGANMDLMNDEGLTALTMTLLRFLSLKHQIVIWEKGFLEEWDSPKNNEDKIKKWYSIASFFNFNNCPDESNLLNQSETDLSTNVPLLNTPKQAYLFDTKYHTVPKPKVKKKKKKNKRKKSKKKKTKKRTKKNKNLKFKREDTVFLEKLGKLKDMIFGLLDNGANPNSGETPLKPLTLSLFSDDYSLVSKILESGAKPDVTIDENVTNLHILAAIEPSEDKVKMCEVLLKHQADPNLKTNRFWVELKKIFQEEASMDSANPLHLISIREDFVNDTGKLFCKMAEILIGGGCNLNDLYLGHSPLSLAVLRNNKDLIETFLKSNTIDPHMVLKNDMGNALTVLVLKKFATILDKGTKKKIIKTLLANGFNPFVPVCSFENSMSFIKNKLQEESKNKTKKLASSKKKKKQKQKKKSNKRSKRLQKQAKKLQKELFEIAGYIINEARKLLFRHIASKAVYYLYILTLEMLFNDPLIATLTQFNNIEETIRLLKLHFNSGIIGMDFLNPNAVLDLLKFIKFHNSVTNKHISDDDIEDMIAKTDFSLSIAPLTRTVEADLDIEKYNVCFQCLERKNKRLMLCPNCELFYFCSKHCNELNKKLFNYHTCPLFYSDIDEDLDSDQKNVTKLTILLDLAATIRKETTTLVKLKELLESSAKSHLKTRVMRERATFLISESKSLKKEKNRILEDNFLVDTGSERKTVKIREKKVAAQSKLVNLQDAIASLEQISKNIFQSSTGASRSLSSKIPTYVNPTFISTTWASMPLTPTIVSKVVLLSTQKTPSFLPAPRPITQMLNEQTLSFRRPSQIVPKTTLPSTKTIQQSPEARDDRRIERPEKLQKRKTRLAYELLKTGNKAYYLELLSKIFADFNLPLMLLPYACYKDGQVYYSMSTNKYFENSFRKLNIPK